MYIDEITLEKILCSNKNNKLVYILIKFLWHTGARLVEVLDISPRSILLDSSCIRINNRRKRTREDEYYREIKVPYDLINDLIAFIEKNEIQEDDKIFKFTSKTAINYIRLACIAAKLEGKITPKIFRYSFAQNRITMGIDDFELNYLLGNADIKKTRLYRNSNINKHIA